MACDLSAVCYKKYHALIIFFLEIILAVIGVYVSVISLKTIGQCYTKPCEIDDGLAGLWRVDSGTSFGLLVSGASYAFHPLIGLIIANIAKLRSNNFIAGIFLGVAVMNCISSMVDAVRWGTKAKMLFDLTEHYQHIKGSADVRINHGPEDLFSSLSTATSFYFIFDIMLIIVLSTKVEESIDREQVPFLQS